MSFVSSGIFQAVWRWREALFGSFIALCGMVWAVTQQGVLAAAGTSIAIVGALIIFGGIQRRRFRVGDVGPGVVQVDERMLTYYGPEDGGTIAVDALQSVELDPSVKPAHWILTESGGQPLRVPTNARNAEVLFDVFASLEGIRTEDMLGKLRANPSAMVPVWNAGQRRLH